jgi:hypothetical protein
LLPFCARSSFLSLRLRSWTPLCDAIRCACSLVSSRVQHFDVTQNLVLGTNQTVPLCRFLLMNPLPGRCFVSSHQAVRRSPCVCAARLSVALGLYPLSRDCASQLGSPLLSLAVSLLCVDNRRGLASARARAHCTTGGTGCSNGTSRLVRDQICRSLGSAAIADLRCFPFFSTAFGSVSALAWFSHSPGCTDWLMSGMVCRQDRLRWLVCARDRSSHLSGSVCRLPLSVRRFR